MTDTFRALCVELLSALEREGYAHWVNGPDEDDLCLRARAALAEADEPAAPVPPADGEVAELVKLLQYEARDSGPHEGAHPSWCAAMERAAELLQRQVLVPVAVSERLPRPQDCMPHPRTKRGNWCWGLERCEVYLAWPVRWRLMHIEAVELEASHWLPARALPLPEVSNG